MPGLLNFNIADAAIRGLEQELKRQEKKVRKGAAIALTKTAKRAEAAIREDMPRVFDRPTRWTLNGLFTVPANYRSGKFVAQVKAKDGVSATPSTGRGSGKYGVPAAYYLETLVKGGQRSAKGYEKKLRALGILGDNEFTVPGKAMRLNRFGNLTAATYSKIIADVQGANVGIQQGFGQSTTRRGRKGYFYSPNLRPRGIYVRQSKKRIVPALVFVNGAPTYKPRLDFYGIADKTFLRYIDDELDAAIDFLSQPYRGPGARR